jgi:glycosyltransferase involved in cell wall biosynthesis
MPAVSIIIAAQNAGDTLAATLRSVLGQALEDFEVIVVDDGSTDATASVAARTGDQRVQVLSISRGGASAARNAGLSAAKGRYVTFLDADDLWTQDKLGAQRDALVRSHSAAVAYSWTMLIDTRGGYLFAKRPSRYRGNVHRDLLVNLFLGSGSNIMIDRDRLRTDLRFDESLAVAEDWDLQLRLAREHEFVYVPAYQILYRLVPGSRSSRTDELCRVMPAIAQRELLFEQDPSRLARRATAMIQNYICLQDILRSSQHLDLRAAKRHWAAAVVAPHRLFQPRCYALLGLFVGLSLVPPERRGPAVHRMLRLYGKIFGRAARAAHAKLAASLAPRPDREWILSTSE